MEAKLEHLKLIQGVVLRLAGNSFLLKAWTVTLTAGLSGFAAADAERSFAWIAVFVVVVFAILDAYYLALERAYRRLYTEVARAPHDERWTLAVNAPGVGDILSSLRSLSVWLLHGVALALALGVALST